MSFNISNIPQRENLRGFEGLAYKTKPAETLKEFGYEYKPAWGAKLFETMEKKDADTFGEEVIEAARFLDEKKTLAGKSRDGDLKNIVADYEDRARLTFDPVSEYQQKQSGHASYDSGKFNGGVEGGEAKLRGNGQKFAVPVATLSQPNPYHVNTNIRLK